MTLHLTRRAMFAAAGASALVPGAALANGPPALRPMTGGAKPISAEERKGRVAKLQRLLTDQGVDALIVESGTSLDYFTGIQWWRSERTTAAVIPAKGEVVIVTPGLRGAIDPRDARRRRRCAALERATRVPSNGSSRPAGPRRDLGQDRL